MKVASIQLECRDDESTIERIHRAEELCRRAQDADLILLPEIWATGYFNFDRYREEAEELDGPYVQRLSNLARSLGAYIFSGSFVERDGDQYFNTSVLFDRRGDIVGTYRKIHLFRYGSLEGEILTAGSELGMCDTEFGKIGLTTCYDLRFPELYRRQVDAGAEIFLVTAAWPHRRLNHWNILNSSRALENQCFLISCNGTGTTHNVLLGGGSQVVDPWGNVTAYGGEHESIVKAEIDPAQVKAIREEFPSLKHRVLT